MQAGLPAALQPLNDRNRWQSFERITGLTKHLTILASAACVLLAVAGCSKQNTGPKTVDGMSPVATLEMHQIQAAYIASASGGDGTLYYQGHAYPFHVGGVGIGGIGASTLHATGDVYGMTQLSQFAGTYAQGRYGFALGNLSGGDLWLKNDAGVILHLNAKRTGLMLTLGGDAVVISFK
jgi:hypothetical protein